MGWTHEKTMRLVEIYEETAEYHHPADNRKRTK